MNFFLKQNLRSKLLITLGVSLFTGLITVGSLLYSQFRSFLLQQEKEILAQYAHLAEQSLPVEHLLAPESQYLKEFADRTGRILNCRVTLIDAAGRVLADSEVPVNQLGMVENHLNRPEVQQSLREGLGFNVRRSATVGQNLLYFSKLIRVNERNAGFLRLALLAEKTQRMLRLSQYYFFGGGALVLMISAALVLLLSRKMNRHLQEVTGQARRIAAGDLQAQIRVNSGDELQELSENLNEMAAKIAEYLEKSARERQELNTVISSINEGIVAIGPGKKIMFFNDRALQLLNDTSKDVRDKYYYQVIRSQHLNFLLNRFFEKPFFASDEIQVEKDRTLEIVLTPFGVENQSRKGVVVLLRDISQYKKLEKIRRDFVANVSHEFKTPLAAIRGYGETLLDWALEDPNVNRKYAKKIIDQSLRLENLVSDLLELARIERLQNIQLTPFNPNPIIQDVLGQYAEIAQRQRLKLVAELDAQERQILGDPEMFRSIIANLVDNAIKYTPEEGDIRVLSQINAKYCTFSVKDNGIGIPVKEQERIFERFYRVDKARTRDIGGTGLGLSIVKHLAEIQQAEVWVQSEPNKGSSFSVKFRLAEGAGERVKDER